MSIPTINTDILRSVIEHVFMPPKLPQEAPDEETERNTNLVLCRSLIEAAQDFLKIIPSSESDLWRRMIKMMELVHDAVETPLKDDVLRRALLDMALGGTYR
jgi:hypothetical protein